MRNSRSFWTSAPELAADLVDMELYALAKIAKREQILLNPSSLFQITRMTVHSRTGKTAFRFSVRFSQYTG